MSEQINRESINNHTSPDDAVAVTSPEEAVVVTSRIDVAASCDSEEHANISYSDVVASPNSFSKEILILVLANDIVTRITKRSIHLPRILKSVLQRDRLLLGIVVPGTQDRGTTLQRVNRPSIDTPPVCFVHSVLQYIQNESFDKSTIKKIKEANLTLRKIGANSIMSKAKLQSYAFSNDKVLQKKKFLDLYNWCKIAKYIISK
tara:strand:- start:832 stop:1443 length:612 start_codon:yes stop_codon:yes gene_type:complete